MSEVLKGLVDLLALEQIEENLFRGQSQDLGWKRVYGGQVLGQALSAAAKTLPDDRHVHSMHAYFLRPGDASRPIVYEVDRIRDGKSFTTRRVVAIQGGRPIFNMSASFQIQEDGFSHQNTMPDAPDPLSLPTDQERQMVYLDKLNDGMRERVLSPRPFEVRDANPLTHPYKPDTQPPERMYWFKTNGQLPNDPALHHYLLAYASDYSFMTTSLFPHGVSWLTRGMQVASIDHVMWYHRPFRIDEWLLHVIKSPSASGARGFVRGEIYNQSGELVASTAQEGLIRNRGV